MPFRKVKIQKTEFVSWKTILANLFIGSSNIKKRSGQDSSVQTGMNNLGSGVCVTKKGPASWQDLFTKHMIYST